ncbi:MAG TPA: hypothetical protein VIK86_05190 [Candidatus Paceibacterota bacterium]
MKWITLIVCLFFFQSQAQHLHLSIVENSIRVKNDSLYFKYKFQNNSDSTLVLYNTRHVWLDAAWIEKINLHADSYKITPLPCVLIDIYNHNNELPKLYFPPTRHNSRQPVYDIGKYIVFKPKESKEYEYTQALWPSRFNKGEYKLQLVYFSNKYYKYKFINAKKKDKRLKNSVMFRGVIKSNNVKFYYTPPPPGYYHQ